MTFPASPTDGQLYPVATPAYSFSAAIGAWLRYIAAGAAVPVAATQAQVNAGTDAADFVTPATLASKLAPVLAVTVHDKGNYATLAALAAAIPAGVQGDHAILTTGSTGQSTVALWDSALGTPAWVDTGVTPGSGLSSVSVTAPVTGNGTGGSPIAVSNATTAAAGLLTAADKTKLDGIASGATVGLTAVTATAPLSGSGTAGSPLVIAAATDLLPGSMSAADKTKLDGLSSGTSLTATGIYGTGVGGLFLVNDSGNNNTPPARGTSGVYTSVATITFSGRSWTNDQGNLTAGATYKWVDSFNTGTIKMGLIVRTA